MKLFFANISAAVLLCSVAFTGVQAQGPTPVLVDISPCMNLEANADRYACYDKLEAAVRAARDAQQLTVTPPVVAPSVNPQPNVSTNSPPAPATAPVQRAATAVETFGQQNPVSTQAAEVVANQDGEEELHDTITALQEREPNRWLITLASGQVWYQSNSERFRLVKGMDVRIYPSPLRGSYRLARDDGKQTGFIQVARVK
ncbi:MAG: hypothetical protein V4628_00760 [Pseudomonadota bacterium]